MGGLFTTVAAETPSADSARPSDAITRQAIAAPFAIALPGNTGPVARSTPWGSFVQRMSYVNGAGQLSMSSLTASHLRSMPACGDSGVIVTMGVVGAVLSTHVPAEQNPVGSSVVGQAVLVGTGAPLQLPDEQKSLFVHGLSSSQAALFGQPMHPS